jgi:sugar phosphate isomerase/epimerase
MLAGMLGRFFPGNWRPPADEIRFAAASGFDALQIRSDRPGELAAVLRADPSEVGRVFAEAGVEPVVESLLRLNEFPSIADALRSNLPALAGLGVRRVHIHPVPGARDVDVPELEQRLPDLFAAAVSLAHDEGLILGVEHNARAHRLLVEPEACAALLVAVPGLSFVWDLNHAEPHQAAAFAALRERLSLVHVSDTPLPTTNHHLPLGRGNVDFSPLVGIEVPLILEIGGLPESGGPGFDTDDALRDSLAQLRRLVSHRSV